MKHPKLLTEVTRLQGELDEARAAALRAMSDECAPLPGPWKWTHAAHDLVTIEAGSGTAIALHRNGALSLKGISYVSQSVHAALRQQLEAEQRAESESC